MPFARPSVGRHYIQVEKFEDCRTLHPLRCTYDGIFRHTGMERRNSNCATPNLEEAHCVCCRIFLLLLRRIFLHRHILSSHLVSGYIRRFRYPIRPTQSSLSLRKYPADHHFRYDDHEVWMASSLGLFLHCLYVHRCWSHDNTWRKY